MGPKEDGAECHAWTGPDDALSDAGRATRSGDARRAGLLRTFGCES